MPESNRPSEIRAVLFDFDGTLADSFSAITASTNHVRESYGLPPLDQPTVMRYVGFGLENLLENLAPGAPLAEAVERYREHHTPAMLSDTKLIPGVLETVAELQTRGYRMAVCSNKKVAFTKQLVEILGIGSHFDAVLGPDDVGTPKPDPAMLLEALNRLGATAEQAVYIGDMAIDVHTAKAAGIPVWLVPGGAAGMESATDAGPDRVLDQFADLLQLLP